MAGIPSGSSLKRSSLAAHLEQDSLLSSARRKEKSHSFASQMATSSLERKLLATQEAQRNLENQLREKDIQIERLESDRRFLAEREKEEREEKEAERQGRDEEKSKAESTIRTMRNQLMQLQGDYDDLKDSYSSQQRTTALAQSTQRTQTQTLKHQISTLESELAKYQQQAKENGDTVQQLQDKLEEMSLSRARFNHSFKGEGSDGPEKDDDQPKDWEIVREELRRQSTYLKTLESANTRLTGDVVVLRQRASNTEILKEEKRALERRLEGVEKLRTRCAELERELEARKKELAALHSTASATSSTELTREVAELRIQQIRTLEELGTYKFDLRISQARVSELEETVVALKKELENAKKARDDYELRVLNAERKAEIEKRECGFLKAMVSSFEAERSVAISEDGNETQILDSDRSILVDERVEALESTIEELQAINAQMEGALREARQGNAVELAEKERLQRLKAEEELVTLQKAETSYIDKIDNLEQKLWELQGDIASGSHVPPGTRVLQLKENPASQWEELRRDVLRGLKKENEALLKRLASLDKGRSGSSKEQQAVAGSSAVGQGSDADLVPRESLDRIERERDALEKVVQRGEKRLTRLQQVYAQKSKEFREAIQEIVGFKLAFYDNGQVRVTSQYDLGASFVFKPTSSESGEPSSLGKMQLIGQGEGGPEEIQQFLRYWIEEEMCIPGFMASITLECYDKEKREREKSRSVRR